MRTLLNLLLLPCLFVGCRISYPDIVFPETPLSSSFIAESTQTVALYLHPSRNPKHDLLFSNLITLDLLSRGYVVKAVNAKLSPAQTANLQRLNSHAILIDSLRKLPEVQTSDALLLANLVVRDASLKLQSGSRFPNAFAATGKITLCSIPSGQILASSKFLDTAHVIREEFRRFKLEQNRFVLERGLNTALSFLPIREGTKSDQVKQRIPIVIYVDNSFRDRFPTDWRDRVVRRMLFVNDIYVSQTGIFFDIQQIKQWDSWFSESLDNGLERLQLKIQQGPWLSVGISFDNMFGRDDARGHYVGLGSFVSGSGIMIVVPTLPGLGAWNSLDDASILAHEIGHVLGLPHIRNPRSIMFPTTSTMSVAFDSISLRMLKTFARDLLGLSPEDRCRRRLHALNSWFTSGQADRVQYIATMHNDISSLWKLGKGISPSDTTAKIDTAECRVLLSQFVKDPVLTEAILGAVDSDYKRWDLAVLRFKHVLALKPRLMEAYDYLGYLYNQLGDFVKSRSIFYEVQKLDPTWLSDL